MKFIPNPRFEEQVARSAGVKALLEGLAADGARLYRDGVPVDEGDLADSIFGEVGLTGDGYVGRVGAEDWKAALIEFGTSRRPATPALRQAIEALGLEIRDTR